MTHANFESIIKKHIKNYALTNQEVGLTIYDVLSNKKDFTYNQSETFYPASTFKTFAAYYILKNLEPTSTLSTTLSYTGEIKNGVISGDLILKSEGDPYLLSNDLYDMIFSLQVLGVSEIKGKLIIISELPSLRSISNVGLDDQAYNQSIAPFNVNFNRFKAIKSGSSYYALPFTSELEIQKSPKPLEPGLIFKRSPGKKEKWTYYNSGKWYYELPLRDATHLNAHYFLGLVKRNGIKISNKYEVKKSITNDITIHKKDSLQIWRLIDLALEFSNNFFIEILLLKATNTTNLKEASLVMKEYFLNNFKEINFKDVEFDRGSGLTVNTLMKSELQASFLAKVALERFADKYFISYFSLAGTGGFLAKKYLSKSTHESFFAKTGSMDYVNNICGYIVTKTPKTFCLMVNDKKNRELLQGPNSPELEQLRQSAKEWKKRTDRFIEAVLTSYLNY